jgi:hypothetical protein
VPVPDPHPGSPVELTSTDLLLRSLHVPWHGETNASLPDTLKNAAFDPDAVKVMTSAYEEATRRSRASGSFRPSNRDTR